MAITLSFGSALADRGIFRGSVVRLLAICTGSALDQRCTLMYEVRQIGVLRHISTLFGYIWRSVSTAGEPASFR